MDPFAPGFLNRLPAAPRKVAIVRASRIGDFLCATPALRAFRAALPEAEITLIGLPFVRDLVMRSPHLDRFVEFPGYPGMAEQFFDARRALEFFAAMQAESFDLAIQLHGSGVYSNPFALMLGALWTAGPVLDSTWPSRLDAAFLLPATGREAARWLAFADFLGAPPRGDHSEFPLWRTDHAVAAELLAGAARPLIGVHPGSREESKRWPPAAFAAAAGDLASRTGGTIVILGGPDDQELAVEIAGRLRGPVIDLSGCVSLPQLGAVIDELSILLTNDSSPAHVAYALGTRAVTIFGETDPARWGPPPSARFQVVTAPGRSTLEAEPGRANPFAIERIPPADVVHAALRALDAPDLPAA